VVPIEAIFVQLKAKQIQS